MIDKILDKINLNIEKNKEVKYVSSGKKQRPAIGCALIKNPDIIIADKPNSSLDASNPKNIM